MVAANPDSTGRPNNFGLQLSWVTSTGGRSSAWTYHRGFNVSLFTIETGNPRYLFGMWPSGIDLELPRGEYHERLRKGDVLICYTDGISDGLASPDLGYGQNSDGRDHKARLRAVSHV
jgi:Stage II sporulation protein E (SpoIIE)